MKPARAERTALGARIVVVERRAATKVEPSDHDRLGEILREELRAIDALTVSFGRVMGWTSGDIGVEIHAQIAPSGQGSAIRLVQRGSLARTKLLLEVGGGALSGAAVLLLLMTYVVPWPIPAVVAALLVAATAAWGARSANRRRRALEATADALVAALESTSRESRVRVLDEPVGEVEDEVASASVSDPRAASSRART